ncbi:hypothetical protein PABG_11517 [Paracoccidioides brasiliensis Pb03]|nr:hypothetical protein PABG_11517 [Paracoccidioides brasiliensis Pb03]
MHDKVGPVKLYGAKASPWISSTALAYVYVDVIVAVIDKLRQVTGSCLLPIRELVCALCLRLPVLGNMIIRANANVPIRTSVEVRPIILGASRLAKLCVKGFGSQSFGSKEFMLDFDVSQN